MSLFGFVRSVPCTGPSDNMILRPMPYPTLLHQQAMLWWSGSFPMSRESRRNQGTRWVLPCWKPSLESAPICILRRSAARTLWQLRGCLNFLTQKTCITVIMLRTTLQQLTKMNFSFKPSFKLNTCMTDYLIYIYIYFNYLNYMKCFEMWNVSVYLNK